MGGKLPQSPVKPIGHGCHRIADTLLIHLLAGLQGLVAPQSELGAFEVPTVLYRKEWIFSVFTSPSTSRLVTSGPCRL